jgi:DNA-binding NarL/FixJ family response regulator
MNNKLVVSVGVACTLPMHKASGVCATTVAISPHRNFAIKSVLSPRELLVVENLSKGFTYADVAGQMQISRYTVMSYVRRIFTKLEVNSKTEAVLVAIDLGLLKR